MFVIKIKPIDQCVQKLSSDLFLVEDNLNEDIYLLCFFSLIQESVQDAVGYQRVYVVVACSKQQQQLNTLADLGFHCIRENKDPKN